MQQNGCHQVSAIVANPGETPFADIASPITAIFGINGESIKKFHFIRYFILTQLIKRKMGVYNLSCWKSIVFTLWFKAA